ncbi:hypothetical protein LY90DRAFT_507825 [Neocallimastix californiae]|uniref:Mid2 domain-containing protein n=1 Tax=Neocallimastix californiae TaxID=1754190 RepID=A0A1Y2D494_9FUNG|nr:hypothetical protein LY90DRAFT_507825 [Neocallimastix californiae]|eukprot:ORY54093.1 hypothetical protein LY90DRAFT_507825 [Neocallimastix californiae]
MKFQSIVLFSIYFSLAYTKAISTENKIINEKETETITKTTSSSRKDILIISKSVVIHPSSNPKHEKLGDTTKILENINTLTSNNDDLKENSLSEQKQQKEQEQPEVQKQITSTEFTIKPTPTNTSTSTSTNASTNTSINTPINISINTSNNTTVIKNDEILPVNTIKQEYHEQESAVANSKNCDTEQSINNLDINVEVDKSEDNSIQTTSNSSFIAYGLAGSAVAVSAGVLVWVKRSKIQNFKESNKMEIIYSEPMYF